MSSVVAIEVNDSGVILSDGEAVIVNSPGYCIQQTQSILFGADAMAKARLLPNECHSSFWSQLATAQSSSIDKHSINLALLHLRDVWSQAPENADRAILTVPANYTKTGLGILLGLCNQITIPVKALVHHAALTPRYEQHDGMTVHIELLLHDTVITFLEEDGQDFRVNSTEILSNVGLEDIYKKIAKHIASHFVSHTRFDPLHTAENEQQLYNAIDNWIHLANSNEAVVCQLHHDQQDYEVTVNADVLKNICRVYVDKIIDKVLAKHPQEKLFAAVSHKVGELLNFNDHAALRGIDALTLVPGHHASFAIDNAEAILAGDDQMYLIKQLPYKTVVYESQPIQQNALNIQDQPTHLLVCNAAYRIESHLYLHSSDNAKNRFELNTQEKDALIAIRKDASGVWVEPLNNNRVMLNDRLIHAGSYPSVGDHLMVNDVSETLDFIKVLN